MAANVDPIFSKLGVVLGSSTITAAANDLIGQAVGNQIVFSADPTNGNFIQRLRFKALGTNSAATVARIYFNPNDTYKATLLSAVSGTPTGTPSGSGGTLATGAYFAKIYAVDQYGAATAASTETASVSVTGPTGSIAWAWTAVTGAVSYLIYVGGATGAQVTQFASATNSYTQTASLGTWITNLTPNLQNILYGEQALPITTASSSAPLPDIDYILNIAIPPNTNVVVGLGAAAAAGWQVTVIGGVY
jgi:hypothetical protein